MAVSPPKSVSAPAGGPPPAGDVEGGPPDAQAMMAKAAEQLGGALPEGSYKVASIKKLVDSTNKAIPKLLGDNAPQGEVPMPPMEGARHEGKLPVEVVLPAAILLDQAGNVEPKYRLDPTALVDDDALYDVCDLLAMASKDKAVLDFMQGKGEEPDADDAGGPPDGDADDMGKKKRPPMPEGVRSAMG